MPPLFPARLLRRVLPVAAVCAALIILPLHADLFDGSSSMPAVSGVNGKLDFRGGVARNTGVGFAAASMSMPVPHSFGIQVDGTIGSIGEHTTQGGQLHFFWRDPAIGLIGPTVQRAWDNSRFYNRFGAEGEYYLPQFMLAGRAGYQNGFIHHGAYTSGDLYWYVTDNLALIPGFRSSDDHIWGRAGAEWQPELISSVPGLALFGSTGAGNHGYAFGIGGIRLYFGEDKSLKRRHREDDPANTVPDDITDNFTQPSLTHNTAPEGCKLDCGDGGDIGDGGGDGGGD